MPYKNKEDRAEAVRRHRERKRKELALTNGDILHKFLTEHLNCEVAPFQNFIFLCQNNLLFDNDGLKERATGKLFYHPRGIYLSKGVFVIVLETT